jgi:hypothetical protein
MAAVNVNRVPHSVLPAETVALAIVRERLLQRLFLAIHAPFVGRRATASHRQVTGEDFRSAFSCLFRLLRGAEN